MEEWIQELKLTILEEDIVRLEALMDSMPSTDNTDLADKASHLIEEAIDLCQKKQRGLGTEIAKMKNIKKCLHSYSR